MPLSRLSMGPAKYTPLEHGGLEVVEQHELPEVVPGSSPPLDRRSSLNQPEPFQTAAYYTDKEEEHGSYFVNGNRPESVAPPYHEITRPSYINADGKDPNVVAQEIRLEKEGRRYCGMRKAVLIALIAAVALIICVGAILGGVLGTILSHKHESSSSSSADNSSTPYLQAMSGTGFATTTTADGSGRTLMYYQDPTGRIIENSYLSNEWTLADHNNINSSIVTTQATQGSPLAAVSYQMDGKTYRQLFFISSTGGIMQTNSTQTNGSIATSWSIPWPITNDTAVSNGIGLAACWSPKLMNGIRVFYPSQYGYIQEVALTFGQPEWWMGEEFDGSDASSGVACGVYNDATDQYLNLYLRNGTTGAVKQVFYNYEPQYDFWDWTDGPASWSNQTIAKGSDIALCSDSNQSEYIFYQLEGGLITRGVVNPSASGYESFNTMQGANVGTKLAASFVDGGAFVLFQNRTSSSTMYYSDVSRNGGSVMNGAVP